MIERLEYLVFAVLVAVAVLAWTIAVVGFARI